MYRNGEAHIDTARRLAVFCKYSTTLCSGGSPGALYLYNIRWPYFWDQSLTSLVLPEQSEVAYRLNRDMQEKGIIARDCLPATHCRGTTATGPLHGGGCRGTSTMTAAVRQWSLGSLLRVAGSQRWTLDREQRGDNPRQSFLPPAVWTSESQSQNSFLHHGQDKPPPLRVLLWK